MKPYKHVTDGAKQLLVLLSVALLLFLCACGGEKKERSDANMEVMALNIMDSDFAEENYPAGYDVAAAIEKGLITTSIGERNYQALEAAYMAGLNYYLEQTIHLSDYEQELHGNGYNFFSVEENPYCRYRAYGRQNLYLRNTAYIERLSAEQLAILESAVNGDTVQISSELLDLVADTWKDMIVIHLEPDDLSVYKINYEMDAINGFDAYNDALTLILGYCTEYDEKGNIISDEQEDNKYAVAKATCEKIERELEQSLDCHVKVFLIVGDKVYENN